MVIQHQHASWLQRRVGEPPVSLKEQLVMVMIAFQRQPVQWALPLSTVSRSLPMQGMAFKWRAESALPGELQRLRIDAEADVALITLSRPLHHVRQPLPLWL